MLPVDRALSIYGLWRRSEPKGVRERLSKNLMEGLSKTGASATISRCYRYPFMLLAAEANGVIALRMIKLMCGGKSARREANLMVSEKIKAAFETTTSLMAGSSGEEIVDHAVDRSAAHQCARNNTRRSEIDRARCTNGFATCLLADQSRFFSASNSLCGYRTLVSAFRISTLRSTLRRRPLAW